jgi:hypothetical protein
MNPTTKRILQVISSFGLVLSFFPAFLVYGGTLEKQTYLNLMLLGMCLWFGTAVFWIKSKSLEEKEQ